MKTRFILFVVCVAIILPISAEIFNFTLPTNNQQLIDEALSGAFVKITQSYELCDSISNEYFGRDGKDYFNKVSFVGIKTECGLIVSSAIEHPWLCDEDFDEYKGIYKPVLKKSSTISNLNDEKKSIISVDLLSVGDRIGGLSIISDSTWCEHGLCVDSIAGEKRGWLVWLSSNDFENADSISLTSISKTIDISADGESIDVEAPELEEKVCGGIYITYIQTNIGQIMFYLTGYMVKEAKGWQIIFPFIKPEKNGIKLTPIDSDVWNNIDQIKTKKK